MRRPLTRLLPPAFALVVPLALGCGGPAPTKGPAPAAVAAPPPAATQEVAGGAAGGEVSTVPAPASELGGEPVRLEAFGSEAAMRAFVAPAVAERRRERAEERRVDAWAGPPPGRAAAKPVQATAPPAARASAGPAAPGASESVTNAQHAGVDEGGIVKVHGEHLVVLRRGRLFTIKVGGGDLRPVFATDAFGPGVDPGDAWYDEMLVVGDTVVVVGFSGDRGGTEVALFDVDAAGKIAHRATYQLRSDDYYSSRNYASRVVGDKLVFYAPLALDFDAPDALASLPAARRWRPGVGRGGFRRIAAFSRLYREPGARAGGDATLHTVTVCDLKSPSFDCRATSLVGSPARSFYVAPGAVYVWAGAEGAGPGGHRAVVYRLPLDGGPPAGVRVFGNPVDQFSFLEGDDGYLNVLVRPDGGGDSMGAPEQGAARALALARVPLASFAAGAAARPVRYARLPAPSPGALQNRFVGDYVLYGAGADRRGNPWGAPVAAAPSLFAHRYAAGGEAVELRLGHDVQRIETMGGDAVVVGGDEALRFTSIALGASPRPAGRFELAGAAPGDTRSHGFFYQPESSAAGLLGLPVVGPRRRPGDGLASVLFLRNEGLRLREVGALAAADAPEGDDRCRASCVDWYGNARPLFLRGRLFALLGYELVEGRVEGGHVRELGRINFAPVAASR